MKAADIDHRFKFHAASRQEKRDEHTSARQAIAQAAHSINAVCPDGRELSLAITKLEEAMFWANAAIARATDEDGAEATNGS